MTRMIWIVVLCVAIGTPAYADSDGAISRTAFAARYVELVESVYEGTDAEVSGDLEVTITRADGETSTSFLDNAYLQYTADPASLDDVLNRYVAAASGLVAPPDAGGLDTLFPVVKDIGYVDGLLQVMRQSGEFEADTSFPFYYEPLNDDLIVLYAFDSENSIRFASREDVESTGLAGRALRTRAIDNLMAYLPGVQREGDDSLSLLVADGNYEASLLLVDEIWSRDVFRVAGDIVVFVPTRDVVLVTGSEDAEGLARARQLIAGNEWPYFISADAFVRTRTGWEKLSAAD